MIAAHVKTAAPYGKIGQSLNIGESAIKSIHGNTRGLKHSQLHRIEKLANRRVPQSEIVSQELARQMAELSLETGRLIGVLLNRKGQVEYVMVGDSKRIWMPDFKRVRVGQDRFRGLRCAHTTLSGSKLSQDDLTDLALLRLDMMAVITVDPKSGLPGLVHCAHLLPATSDAFDSDNDETPYEFLKPAIPAQLDVDFAELIESLEEEMARNRLTARNRQTNRDRVILVSVTTGYMADAEESMAELEELALSADVVVLDKLIQRRNQIDRRTVMGQGKLEELLIRAMRLGADLIVFDCELTPAQVRTLSEATDLKVIDRPQLILDIFAQRAQSREGKIQVELAQLKYMLPRLISGQDSAFSRLAGGIGGRGPGETKLETDRRRVRDRISRLEKEIDNLSLQRQERRKERLRRNLSIVSLVGYTNAGKSTLLNTLTSSEVYAEKKMFATLDPTSRRLRIPYDQEIIINDTVGFIRDLPDDLVAAFRATLEEIADSRLLVHVVDASNPRCVAQIESVDSIISDLHLGDIPQILVLNKADIADPAVVRSLKRQLSGEFGKDCISLAATDPAQVRALSEKMAAFLVGGSDELTASSTHEQNSEIIPNFP